MFNVKMNSMVLIAALAWALVIGLLLGVKLGERRGYDRAVKSAVVVESDDIGYTMEFDDGDIHRYTF